VNNPLNTLRVDQLRLWDSLMEMGLIGATKLGGCNRQAASDLDAQGRDLFVRYCQALHCTMHVDQFGNLFARYEGSDASLAAICVGSHLDTQVTGGKFDGIYGVLAAVEVLRVFEAQKIVPQRTIEIAVWTNEEGARFQPAMQGSGVFCGQLDLQTELNKCDIDGLNIGDELQRTGYLGDEQPGKRDFNEYIELHIEQGPVLENHQKQIGVVRAGQGISWFDVRIHGVASHAGTTPMDYRVDSMGAAAQLIQAVTQLGHDTQDGLSTIGFMQLFPNAINTIPEQIQMKVDLRHPEQTQLLAMGEQLQVLAGQLATTLGIEITLEKLWHSPPIPFELSNVVDKTVKQLGYAHQDIYSGAGHDACNLSKVMPTAMIFIPSINGISHNECEYSTPEDCAAGANVLLQVLLQKVC